MSNGPEVKAITADSEPGRKSLLEMLAVVLLGLATNQRIESSRLFTLASQKVAYDAGIVAQYAQASANKQTDLMTFIRTNLVRPEFRPTLDAWEAAVKAGKGADANLFTNSAYLDAEFKPSKAAQELSDAANLRSESASRHSSDYILMTLITATALFFAGVTTSFKSPTARLMLLTIAGVTLAFAAARLISLPIASH